jgi:hypothetical protein
MASIRHAAVHAFGRGTNGQATLTAALEQEFHADRAVLFGSGTEALRMALRVAMNQVASPRVALPAFTCFDVAAAAVSERARLSFYDIDPNTLAPDLSSLERALQHGARVAVVAPLYGFPVDWGAIAAVLDSYGAIGVEDAAQGGHGDWRGRLVGSLGPISVLSFGRGKGWTGGSGGALLVRDQDPWHGLADALVAEAPGPRGSPAELRVLGGLAAQWALGRPTWYAIPRAIPWLHLGETIYRDPAAPGPMTRAASACLAATWPVAAHEAAARRQSAAAVLEGIGFSTAIRPIAPLPGATPGYLRLPLRLARGLCGFPQPAAVTRLGLARSYPSVLAAIPQVRPLLDGGPSGWPGAAELVRTLWTVPTHSLVTPPERSLLVHQLQAYERRGLPATAGAR